MQENPFDDFPFPDIDDINLDGPMPLHMCCVCAGQPVVTIVAIQSERFPFCEKCSHRSLLLQRGQTHNWPELSIDGLTGRYGTGNDAGWWVLTATQGTDECVVELLDALDEYENTQPKIA